jgi:LAO/AO transport system kinase
LLPEQVKYLARTISMVENEVPGYEKLLIQLSTAIEIPVIGITGPPGAGKSTLINALITKLTAEGKKIAVLAVDPSSPFNFGSLLGDRIRMSTHYNNPNVFIRSLATRGALGGLSTKTIEITDVLKSAGFDYIIIETVGVGQSEMEIAGLADCTILVLVPEGGDEIQALKSGVMEVADIFVVNKADRPGAGEFISGLKKLLPQRHLAEKILPVLPIIATKGEGLDELLNSIHAQLSSAKSHKRQSQLLADKTWQLILSRRMKNVNKAELAAQIEKLLSNGDFNLYKYVEEIV